MYEFSKFRRLEVEVEGNIILHHPNNNFSKTLLSFKK